jgi:hypothetical protein
MGLGRNGGTEKGGKPLTPTPTLSDTTKGYSWYRGTANSHCQDRASGKARHQSVQLNIHKQGLGAKGYWRR